MKKYLFGLGAIVLAIGFSAFSIPSKKSLVDPVIFKYLAPGGSYSEANVESRATTSWSPDQTITCSDNDVKACRITVPLSETVSGLGLQLDASKVTITATNNGAPEYVTNVTVASGSASFINKQ